MSADALLVVPPFLKIAHGPLLGPGMLLGAAHRAGHQVEFLDLNAVWIRERMQRRFVGDHDREPSLRELNEGFRSEVQVPSAIANTHDDVYRRAPLIANGAFGSWAAKRMSALLQPSLVGLSVMYRDQVEPALAIASLVRRQWPQALIVFGGAHVTALQHDIAADARYGELVDRFVFGYAEQTWVELLDAVANQTEIPHQVVRAGDGVAHRAKQDTSVTPMFHDLDRHPSGRLTIPMQTSRGCSYGICAYCTYPHVEGEPCVVPWEPIDIVIADAIRRGAAISFKDSLLTGDRLEEIARRIAGRVPWSACTKLDADLPRCLAKLAAGGCATLEVGLETTHLVGQRLIGKRQRWETFIAFIDAAMVAGISIVVNYMTGLPGIDPDEELACMANVASELERRKPRLVSKLEHNKFQLERLSPMGKDPGAFGIRVVRSAPWSSILKWELDPRGPVRERLIKLGRRSR